MVGSLRSPTVDSAAARRLLQDLFVTEADIIPVPEDNLLRIRIHNSSRPAADRAFAQLIEQLNEAKVTYSPHLLAGRFFIFTGFMPGGEEKLLAALPPEPPTLICRERRDKWCLWLMAKKRSRLLFKQPRS